MTSKSSSRLIQRAFEKKKKDFKGFSLRWMASQLEVSHVYLSHIIRGLRPIPLKIVESLCDILDLDADSKSKIYQEVFRSQGYRPLSKSTSESVKSWNLVPLKDFDLISRWETMAILMSTQLADYDGTASFISDRLFLPKALVVHVMEILEEKDYLVLSEGKLVASDNFYEYQSGGSRMAISKYHRSTLGKAKETLEKKMEIQRASERLITTATLTCSKEDVAQLKSKIAEFLQEFVETAGSSKAEEVYQFGIQFFPLTDSRS